MPKVKTHSGAKKRFKVTGSGKIKRNRAGKRHILTKKSKKRKLQLSHSAICTPGDAKRVELSQFRGKVVGRLLTCTPNWPFINKL